MTREELRELIGRDLPLHSPEDRERYRERMRQRGLDPNINYQELEMSSPLINAHRDTNYSYEVMSLHSHGFYELLCCRSSCGVEYLVGSRRYSLCKGDIILVRPGVSHCAILPNPLELPYERDILWIGEAFQKAFMTVLGFPVMDYDRELPSYLIRTANTQWEYLCDLIHCCVQEEEHKKPFWQTRVVGYALLFLSDLNRSFMSQAGSAMQAETPELLDQIIDYIENNYRHKLTMDQMAKQFYVSERTISSLFHDRLGVTFYQFLTRRRLIAAKSLILEGAALETVSLQSGFRDYSAFFRAFKKEFGLSPREFRRLEEQINIPSSVIT